MGIAILILLVLGLGMYFSSKWKGTSEPEKVQNPTPTPIKVIDASKNNLEPIGLMPDQADAEKASQAMRVKSDFKAFRDKFKAGFAMATEDFIPKYVFVDFETSDLPHEYVIPKPEHFTKFPYVVQAAILVFNSSKELIAKYNSIIKPPDETKFAGEAIQIHGIDSHKCKMEGVDISEMFLFLKTHVTNNTILIAHNIKFDNFMLRLEAKRNGVKLPRTKKFCTMKETTDLCRIYKDWGYSYKYPTLKELTYYTFTNNQKGSLQLNFHDALTDITLYAMCFFELKLHEGLDIA